MRNQIISTSTTHQRGSALDQFLPERIFAPDAKNAAGATPIDSSEIHLEPIVPRGAAPESPARSQVMPPSSQVQAWPMLAAAMVAIGISLLAFAAFAKFGLP